MSKMDISPNSYTIKAKEGSTITEDDIESIEFSFYDKNNKIYYEFEFDEDSEDLFSLDLKICGNKCFPLYSIIKIKIFDSETDESKPYKYSFIRTLLSKEDVVKIQPLKTEFLISQCCKWKFMKIRVKCLCFPNQNIPTGLSSKYSLCYLNSVIQMLFNIPKFRQIIFSYPIKDINHKPHAILLALQQIFSQMSVNSYIHHSNKNTNNNKYLALSKEFVPSTLNLARSFGWTYDDLVEEQDASEFMTIFLKKLQALFLPFPELSNKFNILFGGQFMSNSKLEDFNLFSLPLSKDLKHSLKMCMYPNCEENYAKLYNALQKFIEIAIKKEPIPHKYKVLANALLSILNKTNSSCDNKLQEDLTSCKVFNENDNNLDNKKVSFEVDNLNYELAYSIYKILKDNLDNNVNQYCLKLALALRSMAKAGDNAQYPSKIVKDLSYCLSCIYQNSEPNDIVNNDEIAQLICDFYLDEQIRQMSNVTNYFVKLPQILIFQIRRFGEQNGAYKKKNDNFSFPEKFSMKDYLLPQNHENNYNDDSEYELFSVISHRGELNRGHYIEFSRPSSNKSFWFKFDENHVSLVNKYEAINGNFGELKLVQRSFSVGTKYPQTPVAISKNNYAQNQKIKTQAVYYTPTKQNLSKDPAIQPLCAYMLLYVQKKYIKNIIDLEVPVPDDLKMTKVDITAPIIKPSSPKIDIIRLMTCDYISDMIKADHFCMKNQFIVDRCPITIDRKEVKIETVSDLYAYVQQQIKYKFVLWSCTNGFNPTKPLCILDQKINDAIRSYYDTFLIVQQIKAEMKIERKFSIFDSLFYVLFFDPFNPTEFQFVGLVEFNIGMNVITIFEALKEKLRNAGIFKRSNASKSAETSNDEIAVFYEDKNQSAIYLSPNLVVKDFFNKKNSVNLIVQFVYDIPKFESDLMLCDDYSLYNSSSYEDGVSYTKYMMSARSVCYFNPLFVDYYYKMKYDFFDITFHRISTGDHVTLKVPKKAKMIELSRVLYGAFLEIEKKRHKSSIKDQIIAIQPILKHSSEIINIINHDDLCKENELMNFVINLNNVYAQLFYTNQQILYPSTFPVLAQSESEIRGFLPQFQKHLDLFFELFPLTVFEDPEQKTTKNTTKINKRYPTIRVEISNDSITYTKMLQVVVEKDETTYSDISRLIGIDPCHLQNNSNNGNNEEFDDMYRILMISKGKIVSCVSDYNKKIIEDDCKNYLLRFELVPDDQKVMKNDIIRVRVHYGIRLNSSEVKLFGEPFYFTFHKEEDESSVYQRLKSKYMKFMKPDEKTEFIITDGQLSIMNNSELKSIFNCMQDEHNSSCCICILMNGRVSIKEIIAMDKASLNKQLKIYT